MNRYQMEKARVCERVFEKLNYYSENNVSWCELADEQADFEKMARRYGLLREFRENGIC